MTSDAEDDRSRSSSPEESGGELEGGDMTEHSDSKQTFGQNGHKSTSNAKDPLRPRRKKARRACFACQRAHLTCGDERPCQRCIKRGLQDACQDGHRKKAKYLHDAPNEALMPGANGNLYNQTATINRNLALRAEAQQQAQNDQYFASPNPQPYPVYQQSKPMQPPVLQDAGINPASFNQQSPLSPIAHGLPGSNMVSSSQNTPSLPNPWNGALFDPNDHSLFNFDLASMNFGNHYGALEFGMLGHMATGAGETPPSDTHTQRGSIGPGSGSSHFGNSATGFNGSPGNQNYGYGDHMMNDWSSTQNIYNQQYRNPQDQPHAFAIETNPTNSTSMSDHTTYSPRQGSVNNLPAMANTIQGYSRPVQSRQPHPQISTPNLRASVLPPRKIARTRDPSQIYTNVTTPYPYTAGFHSLISFLQKRFASSPQKTLQIAKSLASIRPSFIATTKTLNRDDLIFMEKCFQRTLLEYESFIEGVGTPTIVARRTGEVVYVGKEFSILTGWRKEVLLGREPNLNVNRGGTSGSGTATGSGANSRAGGTNTPVQRRLSGDNVAGDASPQRPQAVFLAELLDDDSVVNFYADFARLAFGDSRGSVRGKCKLLKYKTKSGTFAQNGGTGGPDDGDEKYSMKRMGSGTVKTKNGIAGEGGMEKLGDRDGKVECAYTWTIKRDVFDIPMLIVMNILPCI